MIRHTINKSEILRKKKDIALIFDKGKEIYVRPLKIKYILKQKEENVSPLRFMVVTGARKFKRAVDRNLIKRRIREAFRKIKHLPAETATTENKSADIVFIYTENKIMDYAEIEKAMTDIVNKLLHKIY